MLRTFGILIFICAPLGISCREYLKEQPKFLTACSTQSANFENCYKENLQNLLINWKSGVPGLPSAGKLDPLRVKRMKIEQNQLTVEFKNVTIRGLSDTKVTKMKVDLASYTFMANTTIPKLRIDSLYKTSGRVLVLQLNGNGKMWMELDNLELSMILRTKLTFDGKLPFLDVKSVESKVNKIGDLRLEFENLFNGNKELEASTQELFNGNWRSFVAPFLPTIEQTLDGLVLKRFQKIFNFIPASYFMEDANWRDSTIV